MIIPSAAALAALNTSSLLGKPSHPFPTLPIICWDHRYAQHPPLFDECKQIIEQRIVKGPNPSAPISFSRTPLPGIYAHAPMSWVSPTGTCRVSIDVPGAVAEETSLVEIQATARTILMKCVLAGDQLGGMTATGRRGNLVVDIVGFSPVQAGTS